MAPVCTAVSPLKVVAAATAVVAMVVPPAATVYKLMVPVEALDNVPEKVRVAVLVQGGVEAKTNVATGLGIVLMVTTISTELALVQATVELMTRA